VNAAFAVDVLARGQVDQNGIFCNHSADSAVRIIVWSLLVNLYAFLLSLDPAGDSCSRFKQRFDAGKSEILTVGNLRANFPQLGPEGFKLLEVKSVLGDC
jgi:hypothetical protein